MDISNICVIGDDKRMDYTAEALYSLGFDVYRDEKYINNKSMIVLAPPANEKMTRLIIPYLEYGQFLYAGAMSNRLKHQCELMKIKYVDYLKIDELTKTNAVLTAKGLIRYALSENVKLNEGRCLVAGYGFCGKAIAKVLSNFDRDISIDILVRRKELKTEIENEGYGFIDLNSYSGFDFMKYRYILLAAMATSALSLPAQETEEPLQDDAVPVAFQAKTMNETLGGVSVVNVRELSDKNYNTYALDNMQGYVGGWNGNSLWGMDDRLILVDGVPRDINNVKPEEIEKITFLKGAQAVVLYGSRGAKGVVLITTKRGQEGAMRINVSGNTGWYVAKSFPEYLGSAEYMTLYNEALANDGLASLYTAEDIYNYGSGLNPYRYPNVDFYSSDYVKKAYNRSEVSAEISGGGTFAKYYTNIGYYRAGDFMDFGKAKNAALEAKLALATKVSAGVFVALSIVMILVG